LVNLHLIGVQKAGTTALASFLSHHPNICLVDGKEAHVFDHPNFLKSSNKMSYAKSQFTNKLAHHKDEQYCMDATPITLFDSTFLMHCYNFNPSAKFIVLLRDPVERAYSHYQMSKSRGEENRSFLSALLQEKKRLREADKDWAFSSSLRVHSYLSRGCYAQQLVQLYRTVPAKQVLVLTSSELKNQHANTLQKINRFLEIEDCHTPAKLGNACALARYCGK